MNIMLALLFIVAMAMSIWSSVISGVVCGSTGGCDCCRTTNGWDYSQCQCYGCDECYTPVSSISLQNIIQFTKYIYAQILLHCLNLFFLTKDTYCLPFQPQQVQYVTNGNSPGPNLIPVNTSLSTANIAPGMAVPVPAMSAGDSPITAQTTHIAEPDSAFCNHSNQELFLVR